MSKTLVILIALIGSSCARSTMAQSRYNTILSSIDTSSVVRSFIGSYAKVTLGDGARNSQYADVHDSSVAIYPRRFWQEVMATRYGESLATPEARHLAYDHWLTIEREWWNSVRAINESIAFEAGWHAVTADSRFILFISPPYDNMVVACLLPNKTIERTKTYEALSTSNSALDMLFVLSKEGAIDTVFVHKVSHD